MDGRVGRVSYSTLRFLEGLRACVIRVVVTFPLLVRDQTTNHCREGTHSLFYFLSEFNDYPYPLWIRSRLQEI